MSIGLMLLTSGILYGGAPGLARMMKMPELREGTRLLCIPFLLEGAAVTANAQLRRELRFGTLATADIVGELGFLLVALFLLWRGLPQWSLAGGLAARYCAHALSVLVRRRRAFRTGCRAHTPHVILAILPPRFSVGGWSMRFHPTWISY